MDLYSESEGGVLASLSLSPIFPTSIPYSPIIHHTLLPTEAFLYQLVLSRPAEPEWTVKGERWGVGWAEMTPSSLFPSDNTASYYMLDLSSGSNGYAPLSSEHRCPSPAAANPKLWRLVYGSKKRGRGGGTPSNLHLTKAITRGPEKNPDLHQCADPLTRLGIHYRLGH